MKVKDLRLHLKADYYLQQIVLRDQHNQRVCCVVWESDLRTKSQAVSLANLLCDRFNAGQEKP
jgi:hypothetical protein